jgi:hypothetical protein
MGIASLTANSSGSAYCFVNYLLEKIHAARKKNNFIKAAKLTDFFLFYRDLDNLYESLLFFTTNKILYIASIIL